MNRSWIATVVLVLASLPPVAAPGQQPAGQAAPKDRIAEARDGLAAAQAAHPGNTPEVASAMLLLSQRLRVARRDIPEVLELARQALSISEAAAGKESILYAEALAEMAKARAAEDHPEVGRPLAEQAVEIARRVSPGTIQLAEIADALGKVCWALADKQCALAAEEQAVAAARASHQQDELYLASMLQDLARIRLAARDSPGTRSAMDESLAIVGRQANPAPQMATLENNAATYFTAAGLLDEALLHTNKALSLSEALYGADSVQAGYAHDNLGDLDFRMGRTQDAWQQLDSAHALFLKWYGPNHTWTARQESRHSIYLAAAGRGREALDLALHAQNSLREYLSLAIRVMPERQALALTDNDRGSLNLALSLIAASPELGTAAVYQEEIRSRALVTEEMAQRQSVLNQGSDPETGVLLKQLERERAALLALTGAGQSAADTQAYNETRSRMERIERSLAEHSLAFRANQRARAVAVDDVRQHLPRQAVLVSYVAYGRMRAVQAKVQKELTPSYLAFVLHPGSDKISVFDLGDAGPINDLVSRERASANAESRSGGLGSMRNERSYRATGEALRKRIWDPLRTEVGDAKLALVVPDGMLNLVPFSSLPLGAGYMVEHGPVIHVLTSERDLVPADTGEKKSGLLAVGGPAFDLADNNLAPSRTRDAAVSCEEFRKLEFHPLPGTEAEVTDLRSSWRRWNGTEPSSLVTGAEATRTHFLAEAEWNRVLHIATHAFLLDKSCGNGNPLLHSGLVFAGANQGREASILTAQQIASLDLSGVDWAVLSACNTGNGELHDGEGVLGLERAFRVAGARSVVMTLWPVDDDVTRRFMHQLYTERLARHATTADAVWDSARKLLLDQRAAGKSTHPWYWAGFVGSGGWE